MIPVGRTRKILLRLTQKAKATLGNIPAAGSRESIAHEYWKRFYARRFEQQGYRVQIEVSLGDGRVDVLATRGQERIAIEIETGKSDVVTNVRRALRARVGKVLVVATTEDAMKKVERDLATGGLLLRGRVDVVLRGKSRS